jgi:telomere length regulation protein
LTSLLLHLVVSLPVRHSAIIALSRSPDFLEAVSSHLSLVAPLTRLLGMLVAEIVSNRTVDPNGNVKPLAFGDEIWAGEDSAKETVRTLRVLLSSAEKRDDEENWQDALRSRYSPSTATSGVDPQRLAPSLEREPLKPTSIEEPAAPRPKRPLISIIGEDEDDDDLEPYDLPPPPSASVQAALESEDPALYQSAFPSQSAATSGAAGAPSQTRKRGRLRPPVYIAELVSYLKGKDPQGAKEEADGEAERIEMGLKEGESLIRRKAGWGGELRTYFEGRSCILFLVLTLMTDRLTNAPSR